MCCGSVKKNFEKKKFSFLCVNKFYDVTKIRKIWLCQNKKCVLNFQKKNTKKHKKNYFPLCFFLEVGYCFILNKRRKIKKWVSYSLLQKKKLNVKQKFIKKKDDVLSRIEDVKKKYSVENEKKKLFSFTKNVWLNKGGSR